MEKKNKNTLKWLLKVAGRKKGFVVALTFLQTLISVLGVYYALLLKKIVDSAVEKNIAAFQRYITGMICLVMLQLVLGAFNRWLYKLARTSIENRFKQRLLETILHKDYSYVSAVHSGEWLNRLTNDAILVGLEYVELLPGLVGAVVRMITALFMILVLERWFAFIMIPGGILLLGMTYAFRGLLKRLYTEILESDGRLRVFLQERISCLMIIKSFAAEKQTADEAARRMEEHKASRMKRNIFTNLFSTGFGAAVQGMYLAGVFYCTNGILNGTISYGTLTAIMQLIGQVQSPFASISGFLPRYYAVCASAERLMEAESFPDDVKALDHETIRRFYTEEFQRFGFRNAEFSYRSEDKLVVLRDFNLEIQKGEIVAFTGHSGCGKSTVLKLLMCMYPLDKGVRYVNERELTAAYRRLFAYVPQGNALMAGSIRDIISFSEKEAGRDEERIANALKIACADEFVEDTDTILGEKGTGLSEGQMQRIAIARAVFSDAPVLLLDEATSALDEQTETKLLENLHSLTDKTVVIVTHRKAALGFCDRVCHFTEDGIEKNDGLNDNVVI